MAFRHIDVTQLPAGRGPHPAASPYDRRVSEHLALTGFEVYQVDLPPNGETVRHDHLVDDVEDMYAFISGSGWVIVDDEQVPVGPGDYVAVSVESQRLVRAGDEGLTLIAVCAPRG